ncbi:MAG: hypothetical protein A2667_02835 [Candidatus Wildermuthbacteria bacterium RIFCSPHIGHO2_01_FULL_47_27]|uniref:Uncharacterized protein n=1 Tax=Candidatus Wildermuthbacteria bacterium RIFCSPHIGHO2_02_FULL_47_17 TaxID=1802452 RepID=A0A1G2R5L6_9BACT|nr:MAG: hypothetical protein UY15_C0014G0003 [Parcubacteria group bacterium GW2011_GWA2_47_9]OHA65056.1 MAG: hypothetical protein A2667_02835 [Candidatus Wildermuthbacteria bacterium RIFCSPHIGHO2_01_FULL_47_27]OHA68103.1 MAG: hypothetical protein A3D59_00885 [Candidatus Wildermuthbacteria bacterium RIFCSPHIGHO2_02_FULL_47_17]OHA75394.1 MAG: hypothetical protein A3I38_01250 [Candidatus Wildermuthbacteria bacterium RIFCSPLOWO2_02_FULL_47_10]
MQSVVAEEVDVQNKYFCSGNPDPKKPSHHWIIDAPRGSISKGRCKLCGATREFQNYLPTAMEALCEIRARRKERHERINPRLRAVGF